METELKIVYSIINTVKKQSNDDSTISERLVRGFIQDYRSTILNEYYENGMTISEECFQTMYNVKFELERPRQFYAFLPKIVRLKDNFGMMLEKAGYNIPVVSSEEFSLGLTNLINKYIPKAKFLGSKAVIFIGNKKSECQNAEGLAAIIDIFEKQLLDTAGLIITADLTAVFDNPDTVPEYNWTTDPFPFPSELIADLKTEILRREFNIILQIKTDKVTDGNEEITQ